MKPKRNEGLESVLGPEDRWTFPLVDGARQISRGPALADLALRAAADAQIPFAEQRAEILQRAAELIASRRAKLIALLVLDAELPIGGAAKQVREAILNCRRIASLVKNYLVAPQRLPGPTGESNELHLVGRGTILTIGFEGTSLTALVTQIVVAFGAGNAVIVRPSSALARSASVIVRAMFDAGIPGAALSFLPGSGGDIEEALTTDERCDGVAFSGPLDAARNVRRQVAERNGPLIPLIDEPSPHFPYVLRFANERTITINTTAAGGNASLIADNE